MSDMELCADDEFAQRSEGFLHWLKQQPGVRVSSKIEISDPRLNGAGRGVVACEQIAQDEELFAIPEDLVLSVQNSKLKDHINFAGEDLDSWLALMVTMVYEYLLGGVSRWSRYFDVLPTDFNTLMFWTDNELRELEGSAVLEKIGRQQADEIILDKVLPLVAKHPELFPPMSGLSSFDSSKGKEIILQLAHRMGTLIMAYAFDIEMDQDEEEKDGEDGYITDDEQEVSKGMVPLADILNADAHRNNARLFQEDGYFIMRSISPIGKDEEIFNDYGDLPRADLLRRYGYITDNYAPFDVAEISLEAICKAAGVNENSPQLEYLNEADTLDDGYALTRPNGEDSLVDAIPSELLVLLRALNMPSDQLDQMRKRGKLPKPELDEQGAKLLIEVLRNRQNDYPTTLAQDHELMQPFNAGVSSGNGRREIALRVRMGEKEVLQSFLDGLQAYLHETTGGQSKRAPSDTTREAKKRRTA